jgi:pullulanase/glycogen debranching enzyme
MEKPNYPIKKIDNLGRLLYVDWNGIERSVYKYWKDTINIKVKYRLFHQETSFDVYDTSGKNILSYSSGVFEINLPRLWSDSYGGIGFKIEKNRLLYWRNILNPKKK